MKVLPTDLKDCFLIEPDLHKDHRGLFWEWFRAEKWEKVFPDLPTFVQDNFSVSHKYVLRGLHFQAPPHGQAKLVSVISGSALDVVVDLRPSSPSFKSHFKVVLSGNRPSMLYVPRGFAHGYLALEDKTTFGYKCDAFYRPEADSGVRYDDPDLNIDWDADAAHLVLSEKDQNLPYLKDIEL